MFLFCQKTMTATKKNEKSEQNHFWQNFFFSESTYRSRGKTNFNFNDQANTLQNDKEKIACFCQILIVIKNKLEIITKPSINFAFVHAFGFQPLFLSVRILWLVFFIVILPSNVCFFPMSNSFSVCAEMCNAM